jgi:folate-binding protein YgfZ
MGSVNPLEGAFFDLSALAKVRVSGADAERYLNGQITSDITRVSEISAVTTCLLNAKGKMEAYVTVSKEEQAFLVDAVPELTGSLQSRLDRYIIADAVETEDVTDRWSILHLVGTSLPQISIECRFGAATRFGVPGIDVWCGRSEHDRVFAEIAGSTSFADQGEAEIFRIEQGVPRWGRELTSDILPPEAGLDQTAIDYDKGCYVGQEVISRMRMSGQRSKKLTGMISLDDYTLEPGMQLLPTGGDGKSVGWITSATRSRRVGRDIALGYVKRPFFPTGFKLEARQPDHLATRNVRVELTDLPFVSGLE